MTEFVVFTIFFVLQCLLSRS